jgi:hypothetical protein
MYGAAVPCFCQAKTVAMIVQIAAIHAGICFLLECTVYYMKPDAIYYKGDDIFCPDDVKLLIRAGKHVLMRNTLIKVRLVIKHCIIWRVFILLLLP